MLETCLLWWLNNGSSVNMRQSEEKSYLPFLCIGLAKYAKYERIINVNGIWDHHENVFFSLIVCGGY
jgi:hypothetical protein